MIEKDLEQKIKSHFDGLYLEDCQIICGRSSYKEDGSDTVIAISAGMRSHDAFSLPMITMPIKISIVTRVEEDAECDKHNSIVDMILEKLEYWHKNGSQMETDLNTPKMMCGELKIDGGSSLTYDSDTGIYTDVINISIRGTEIF